MKKLLLLTIALSLPLAQVVKADNDKDKKKRKHPAEAAEHQQSGGPQAQPARQPSRQPVRQVQRQRVSSEASLDARNRQQMQASNPTSRNRNVERAQANSRVAMQQNRAHRTFDRNSFIVARTRVIRTWHDRIWWRNHFHTTFVLFGGGYYYWNSGYWYPAYGYSPIYNNYAYSEPIYGYNNLAPGQVLENVQLALRDQGYYHGVIDGLVGPQTRSALARYQSDHGLLVTSAVDEPTLVTLGLA